jgi:teichuronic acid biosynthesis glycosyltransferase TuaG
MDLISVVVPVYNCQNYLDKCLSAVINQSYENIEIIVIDDGSTDESGNIIHLWAERDKRIKTIFQKNAGVSASRNRGIDIAKGKYICFFDSDDWIEKGMLTELCAAISLHQADLAYCNFSYEYILGSMAGIHARYNEDVIVSNWEKSEFYLEYLSPYGCAGIIANKMYRLEIIKKNNLRFIDSNIVGGEDSLFNLCYFANVKKSVFVNKILYHYIQRSASLIHIQKSDIIGKYINLIKELTQYFEKYSDPNLQDVIPHLFYHYFTLGLETAIRNNAEDKKILENINQAKSDKVFKKLIIQLLKSQLKNSTSHGSYSRRLRTIVFGLLSLFKADFLILKTSKWWLHHKGKFFIHQYGLYSNIELVDKPLVSIVLPLYNCEDYIVETLKSIKSQTYTNWELIIIDDHSTDASYEIVKAFERQDSRVRVYKNQSNQGASYSRNRGIEMSRGEWVAFIDSDDSWNAQKIEWQMSIVETFNEVFVFTNIFIETEKKEMVKHCLKIPERLEYKVLKRKNLIPLSSVLLKKSILNEAHFEMNALHEDYILWLKILKKGITAYGINQPLTTIRIRKGSKSSNKVNSVIKTYQSYRFIGLGIHESFINTCTNGFRALSKYICIGIMCRKNKINLLKPEDE